MITDPIPPDPHLANVGNFALADLIARILEDHKIDGTLKLKEAQRLFALMSEAARRVDVAIRSAVGTSAT